MKNNKPVSIRQTGGLWEIKDEGRVAQLNKEDKTKIQTAYNISNSNIFCSFCKKKILLEEDIGYYCFICEKNFCKKHARHKIHAPDDFIEKPKQEKKSIFEKTIDKINRLFKK